jgi:hypothetical protein
VEIANLISSPQIAQVYNKDNLVRTEPKIGQQLFEVG